MDFQLPVAVKLLHQGFEGFPAPENWDSGAGGWQGHSYVRVQLLSTVSA